MERHPSRCRTGDPRLPLVPNSKDHMTGASTSASLGTLSGRRPRFFRGTSAEAFDTGRVARPACRSGRPAWTIERRIASPRKPPLPLRLGAPVRFPLDCVRLSDSVALLEAYTSATDLEGIAGRGSAFLARPVSLLIVTSIIEFGITPFHRRERLSPSHEGFAKRLGLL
jgi:hypothetical protein